jgi:hypothetical protein
VPNGSFEETTGNPNIKPGLRCTKYWFGQSVDYHHRLIISTSQITDVPNLGVPVSALCEYLEPVTGDAYISMAIGGYLLENEYQRGESVAVELKEPLIENKKYYFELYYANREFTTVKTEKIVVYTLDLGITFRHEKPYSVRNEMYNYSPYILSDAIVDNFCEWRKFSGVFTAKGDEKFLFIGSMLPAEKIKYLYLKDHKEVPLKKIKKYRTISHNIIIDN